jgi:S-DNA-T family DNA segregation ATPase FtsK/SpoIIIE
LTTPNDEPSNVVQLRPHQEIEPVILDGEIIEPDDDQPLARPAWLGVGRTARRVQGRSLKRTARTIARSIWPTTKLLWLPVRWFFLGAKTGWPGFLHWMFAVPEHQSVGVEKTVRRGGKAKVTTRSRKEAWTMTALQTAIVIPLAPAVLFYILDHYHYLWHGWMWAVAYSPHIVATIVFGALGDTKPLPTITAPRNRGDADPGAMTLILRDVGILRKPDKAGEGGEHVTYATLPTPEGVGFVHTYDLPKTCGKHAGNVIAKRDEIAAALGVDPGWVDITGRGHRFSIWIAESDPFGQVHDHPLLEADSHNVFNPIPVAVGVRGYQVRMPIVGTHFLEAALPNVGKSMFGRGITAGPVLDPHCDIHLFDGKMGKDWQALAPIANTFENGPVKEQIPRLLKWLDWARQEAERRFTLMRSMSDEECPESKITKRMHLENVMRFQWLVIDEAHHFFEDPRILDGLIDYVKGYRAAGMGLLLITQTVEGKLADRFTGLRNAIGSRIALRLIDWQASNQILGDQMNTRGWNAGDLPNVPGLAIIRADMDADGKVDDLAAKARGYYMSNSDWTALCKVGAYLRDLADEDGNPLPQVETPDEWLTAAELLSRLRTHAPEKLPTTVGDPKTLGEFLATRGSRSDKPAGFQERVRTRSSVEAALGLSEGRLAPVLRSSTEPGPVPSMTTPDNPQDNPHDEEPAT